MPGVILVVGGTRKLLWLWRCKRKGSRIVHRLDGINWLHRIQPMPLKNKLSSVIRNFFISFIRKYFADHVIYQSEFVRNWWNRVCKPIKCPEAVIHNAVDLEEFCPKVDIKKGECESAEMRKCEKAGMRKFENREKPDLLCVEGTIDYSPHAIEIIEYLGKRLVKQNLIDKVIIYGTVKNPIKKQYLLSLDFVELNNPIPRKQIHKVYKNSIYLSLDINAACP